MKSYFLLSKTTLTNIANAIREKTHTNDPLSTGDMPNAILSIQGGIDTSDATAAAADVLKGKTAYGQEEKITGTIESQAATTYTPGTSNQVINAGVYLGGDQTILGDANLTAENIKDGVTIFGVVGTFGSNNYYVGDTAPDNTVGNDGDLYMMM